MGEFYDHRGGKNGKHSWCKKCFTKRCRQRYHGIKRPAPERPATLLCREKCKRELPFDRDHFEKKCTRKAAKAKAKLLAGEARAARRSVRSQPRNVVASETFRPEGMMTFGKCCSTA